MLCAGFVLYTGYLAVEGYKSGLNGAEFGFRHEVNLLLLGTKIVNTKCLVARSI